jgi:hypothetical protein
MWQRSNEGTGTNDNWMQTRTLQMVVKVPPYHHHACFSLLPHSPSPKLDAKGEAGMS